MTGTSRRGRTPPKAGVQPEGFILAAQTSDDPTALWAAIRAAVDRDVAQPEGPLSAEPARARAWARRVTGDRDAASIADTAISLGATRIFVLPMAVLEDEEPHDASAPHSAWTALHRLARAHPNVDLQVVGFSSDDAGATSHVIDLLRIEQPANVDLLEVTLARVFGARLDDLGRFLEVLHDGLPDGTTIYLRGSAVNGQSYETGVAFDGRGAGTSDLDLVAIGDEASKLWVAEARLLGGVNSLPLYDGARWVAPALDSMRMDAQRIAGRPVSLQSMAGWFLELRAVVQGQQYVKLDAAE